MQINDKNCFILRLYVGVEPEQQTSRELKDKYGKFAYIIDSFRQSGDSKEVNYQMKIDDEYIEGPGMILHVVNAAKTDVGLSIMGNLSNIDDGLFDAFLLNMNDLHSYAGLLERMVNLDTANGRDFMRQGKEMYLETDPDLPVWADGEYTGRTPIRLKVLPAALPVIVPK